jgi:homoserine O-acetyltransferase/O-succinyltransferase
MPPDFERGNEQEGVMLRAARAVWLLLRVSVACLSTSAVGAAEFAAPTAHDWIAREFHFHTGDVMPELRLHYLTIGTPSGEPVLILHGTTGSGAGLLTPAFAGELFGRGQPLDASRYYLILPDSIGHGRSSKPSDGLRANFPAYDYDDMVAAQYRLVTEGLGITHLRLVLGNSMGGMHAWIWGESYPGFMDALVPMASQPTEMSSRNWMMRRLIVDSIRNDPEWNHGNYSEQPRSARFASVFYGIATTGGTLAWQKLAPTREAADALLDQRMAAPFSGDANDVLYQWDASRNYNPSPGLERIEAAVLAINAADDERNPPETGIMQHALTRIRTARLLLIPASDNTRGHQTTGSAGFWKEPFATWLETVPRRK